MTTILIVDDSKAVTYIVKKFLENEGYDVKVAQSAHRGLDVLRKDKIDLLITDVMMPGMDGFAFAELVKNDPKLKNIPLIFFTAKSDISDEFHGYMTGAESYITKPVKKHDMLDKIERALGKKPAPPKDEVVSRRAAPPPAKGGGKTPKSAELDDAALVGESNAEGKASAQPARGAKPTGKLQEIINIYGSMIEVMWAFSFDKLLTFEDLNVIEKAIDKTCLDFHFMGNLAFSEDGIDLTRFKEKSAEVPIVEINHAFAALIHNFFDLIVDMSRTVSATTHKIVLLGDEEAVVSDLEAALALDGHDVFISTRTENVLQEVTRQTPELVVVATAALGENEMEFCRQIRAKLSDKVPIIFISNSKDRRARKQALEAGADEVLLLPWSKLTLLRMVKRILDPNS